MPRWLWFWIALLLCGLARPATANAFLDVRSGMCGAVTLADVAPPSLATLEVECSDTPDGYTDGWLWQRFDDSAALQSLDGTWIVLIDQTRFERVRAVVAYDDGSLYTQEMRSGALGDGWSVGGYLDFVIPKRAAKPVSLTLGFERLGDWTLVRKVRVIETSDYLANERRWTLLIGGVAGAVIASLAYNLFLFAGLRYAYLRAYILWSVAALAYTLTWTGVVYFLLPGLAGSWGVRVSLWLAALTVFFSIRFFTAFIEESMLPERLVRALHGIGYAVVLVAVGATFERLLPTAIMYQAYSALVLAGIAGIGAGLWIAWRRGSRSAKFYAISWSAPILVVTFRMVRDQGLFAFRGDWAEQGTFAAIAVQSVLLAIAMADRFVRLRDELDRTAAERETLRTLSETDQLCELYNRRGFVRRANDMIDAAEAEPVGLVLLDVDHFKAVNDGFGHDVGDAVLVRIGRTLSEAAPPGAVVGRMGGEEFGVIAPGLGARALADAAERLRASVSAIDAGDIAPGLPRLSVSLGVASEAGTGFVALYRMADQALYRAKQGGRDRVAVHAADNANEPPAARLTGVAEGPAAA